MSLSTEENKKGGLSSDEAQIKPLKGDVTAAIVRENLSEFNLLDVRTYLEREHFNIGVMHIPLDELSMRISEIPVDKNVAMTGEITLRGKVLAVGGIKEKILAAKRAKITEIILCQENKKNIEEIDSIYLKGLTFHYVSNMHQVLDIAITDKKVKNYKNLNVK